jgi:hypothetical protein
MSSHKTKNDLLSALNHIERFHRRRTALIAHVVVSLGVQFLAWANWFSSYALRGNGFSETFFTDRLTLSVVLTFLLIGHFLIMRLAEAKDVLVIKAIQQFDAEDEIIENRRFRLMDEAAESNADPDVREDLRKQTYR